MIKWITDPNIFCWCGQVAIKQVDKDYLCARHNAPKKVNDNKRDFSGGSKTPYGGYESR